MPGNPLTDPNWANDVADQIISVVGQVRDKTTNNAIKVVRGVVFGLLGFFLGLVLAIGGLIFVTRGVQTLLDLFLTWERAVYASYIGTGIILCIVGLFLMSRRHSTD